MIGEIISRLEAKGYVVADLKKFTPSRELLAEHYAEHEGKPFYEPLVEFMGSGDAAYAEVTRHAPARRPAAAAEVAATIGWLVSEQATGIHGATLTVDGGAHVVDAEGIAFLPPA